MYDFNLFYCKVGVSGVALIEVEKMRRTCPKTPTYTCAIRDSLGFIRVSDNT